MSLQAIEGQKVQSANKNAHTRKIDVASEGMIFDTLQKTQYTKPIESTVRELATNAVDSIKEREIARDILTGKSKVEDYYLEREGDKYKHSKFDKSYYDLSRFSNEPNVKLIYRACSNGNGYVDQFVVEDSGVGIGMPRLEGYFDLGYSSKRNTKALLGAFGLGNKVALSTNVDYYIMETRHNGRYYSFKCFSRHIESLVPKFNATGTNPETQFSSGAVVNYEEQDGPNFTRITVPTKRFNKDKFVHAVKSQLLYFPNIDFRVEHYTDAEALEEGKIIYTEDIQFKATVEHTSENIIISNNRIYNKPHVIIVRDTNSEETTGVCYGYVSFEELEMESLRGSVGFRCPIKSVIEDENGVQEVIQDGVNVTPSRESVIWDEETKDYIKKVINSAKDEAANIIAKSVKDMHNPFEWYELVSSAQSGTQGNSKLANLAGIVNLKELDLRFKGTKLTKNTISMLLNQMVKVQEITYASWTKKVSTGIVGTSRWFNASFRYYRDSPYRSTAKDEYISEVSNYNPVLVAQFIGMEEFQKRIEAVYEKDLKDLGLLSKSVLTDLQEEAISILRALCVIHDIPLEKTSLAKQFKSAEALKKFLKESGLLEKYQETYNQLKEFMQIDKLDIKDYAELVIPKEKEEIIKQREEAEKEQEKRRQMSKQQIREENNEVVMHYPKVVNDSSTFFSNKIIFSARDTQIEKLDIINANIKVIYGFAEDREALAHYAEMFLTTHAHKLWGMYRCFSEIVHLNAVNTGSPECLVVMVSKKNGKLFTTLDNFIHVDDFELLEGHIDQEEVLTTSPELMTRFTKRYIYRELSKRNYPALMKVMQELNPEVNDLYKELVEYSKDAENYHSSNLVPTSFMEDLFNAMIEVQVKLHDNPELKVNELDLPNMKITDIGRPYALDPKMLAKIRIFTSIFEEDADTTHYLEVIGYYFLNNNQSIGTDSILLQKVREAFVNAGLDEFKIGEQVNNLEPVNLQIK